MIKSYNIMCELCFAPVRLAEALDKFDRRGKGGSQSRSFRTLVPCVLIAESSTSPRPFLPGGLPFPASPAD